MLWYDLEQSSLPKNSFNLLNLHLACDLALNKIKGSPDPSHFIFAINVGEGRIRHKNDSEFQ